MNGTVIQNNTIIQNTTNQITNSSNSTKIPDPLSEQTNESSEAYNFSRIYTEDGRLIIYFFYLPSCPSCKAVASEVERIGKKYEKSTEWHGFNIQFQKERDSYQQFYKEFNLTSERSGVPTLLVNGTILWGQFEIRDNLEKIINSSLH
jgi:thiol-disulfide isomerase/thioredoxin